LQSSLYTASLGVKPTMKAQDEHERISPLVENCAKCARLSVTEQETF
jgi:hypothetical protein